MYVDIGSARLHEYAMVLRNRSVEIGIKTELLFYHQTTMF